MRAGPARAGGELGVWLLIGSALVQRDGRQGGQPLDAGRPRRRASPRPTTRCTCSTSTCPPASASRESAAYEPGDRAVVADAAGAELGLTICYDMRFPALYRALAKAGAEMLTVPAAFTRPTGEAHWEVLLRARAIETGAFVLAPAQGGTHEDGRGTWGHSMVVGPWGEVLAAGRPRRARRADRRPRPCATSPRRAQAIPALTNERAFAGPVDAARA